MLSNCGLTVVLQLLVLAALSAGSHPADELSPDNKQLGAIGWASSTTDQMQKPDCQPIPASMALCRNIGYGQMRLPNLLGHETMAEVQQQARHWEPLLHQKCHDDAQLFLCSLYTPLCLDSQIPPCRSLCAAVRDKCALRMQQFGFQWPAMFNCSKFPVDNNLCIKQQSTNNASEKVHQLAQDGGPVVIQEPPSDLCVACNQPLNMDNIKEAYCRADVVVRGKIGRILPKKLKLKGRTVVLRDQLSPPKQRRGPKPWFLWNRDTRCCQDVNSNDGAKYLIMARQEKQQLVPTFIVRWQPKDMKIPGIGKQLRRLDCSNHKQTTEIPSSTISSAGENSVSALSRSSAPRLRNRQKNRDRDGRGQRRKNKSGRARNGNRRRRPERNRQETLQDLENPNPFNNSIHHDQTI